MSQIVADPAIPSPSALADIILVDWAVATATGRPRKYVTHDQQLALGRKLMDLPMPTGKTLAQSTFAECEAVAEAWQLVAGRLGEAK